MREQCLSAVGIKRRQCVPEIGRLLREGVAPSLVTTVKSRGQRRVAQPRRLRAEADALPSSSKHVSTA